VLARPEAVHSTELVRQPKYFRCQIKISLRRLLESLPHPRAIARAQFLQNAQEVDSRPAASISTGQTSPPAISARIRTASSVGMRVRASQQQLFF